MKYPLPLQILNLLLNYLTSCWQLLEPLELLQRVNRQETTMHTYPELFPFVEITPYVKTRLVNKMRFCPNDYRCMSCE